MWRLGTVKLLNGPEQQKVIALYGFTDRFDISLNREEAKRRLYPYRWHTKNLYYPKTKILNPFVRYTTSNTRKRTISDLEDEVTVLVSNPTIPNIKFVFYIYRRL